jgi:hypothetical protein
MMRKLKLITSGTSGASILHIVTLTALLLSVKRVRLVFFCKAMALGVRTTCLEGVRHIAVFLYGVLGAQCCCRTGTHCAGQPPLGRERIRKFWPHARKACASACTSQQEGKVLFALTCNPPSLSCRLLSGGLVDVQGLPAKSWSDQVSLFWSVTCCTCKGCPVQQ